MVIYTKETSHTFDLRSGIETSSAYSRVTDYFQFIRLFVIIEKRGRIFQQEKLFQRNINKLLFIQDYLHLHKISSGKHVQLSIM